MMGALRLLPGATDGSVATRGEDPEGRAVMTLDELETWIVHQIAGIYHHTVHRGLGKPPIAAWTEAVSQMSVPHGTARTRIASTRLSATFRRRTRMQRRSAYLSSERVRPEIVCGVSRGVCPCQRRSAARLRREVRHMHALSRTGHDGR
jgi:hypothetical protein